MSSCAHMYQQLLHLLTRTQSRSFFHEQGYHTFSCASPSTAAPCSNLLVMAPGLLMMLMMAPGLLMMLMMAPGLLMMLMMAPDLLMMLMMVPVLLMLLMMAPDLLMMLMMAPDLLMMLMMLMMAPDLLMMAPDPAKPYPLPPSHTVAAPTNTQSQHQYITCLHKTPLKQPAHSLTRSKTPTNQYTVTEEGAIQWLTMAVLHI